MKAFKMARPKTVEAAVSVCGEDFAKTKILAGGTDLLGELKEHTQTPDMVVNLKSIAGLNAIRQTDRGLEIGALVKLYEIEEHGEIAKGWPALVTTVQKTATPQIRNVATVGGNLCQRPRCWYYRDETFKCLKKGGDLCYAREGENEYHAIFDNATCNIIHPSNLAPVLMAYDAQVEIVGPNGKEVLALEDFWVSPEEDISVENMLMPDQVLTTIILPKGSANPVSAYVEAREKQSYDWAICGATAAFRRDGKTVSDARIILSAVAPIPVRRFDLEDLLKGQSVDEKLIDRVCEAAVTDATPLRDNAYKTILLKAVLRRAIRQALEN
ncbi:MAG: FAD binding domain-containing protein [Planctomycetes bacterium]|nr:FAD binding domain-containing protein [Planctomycetota bacterium]